MVLLASPMTKEEILLKIKKNTQLNRIEKMALSKFWKAYTCPIDSTAMLVATYGDGEVAHHSVADRLNRFYDETPEFITAFFEAMAKGEEFRTRFAIYKPLNVS